MTDLIGPARAWRVQRASSLLSCVDAASGSTVITITGDIDLSTAGTLRSRLLNLFAMPLESLTLDLHGVTFMDSRGLSVLVWAQREADARGVAFALAGVQEQPRRALHLTDTASMFRLLDRCHDR